MSSPSASDIPLINLYYHPNCKASHKLMNQVRLYSDSNKLFNFINISSLNRPPPGVNRIPCINYDGKNIHGKECFELVTRLLNGPSSCNIYNTKTKVCSFDENSQTEYQICPNFSNINGSKNSTDGFTGVPTYNGEVKTLQDR